MSTSSRSEELSSEELFRRFAPFVARFLYRLGVGSDGLDDLVQEVFLVVHRRGGYKAGPAKPTSYLATIAAHAASAYRRKQRTEQMRSSDVEVEGLMSTHKGPVHVLEVNERLELLQAALERLEPDFRSTLILADIEGESCASIAASAGLPTGTVYWRLHEARKRLQRALRAEMAGVPAKSTRAPGDDAAERRARGPALALALNPVWLLSDARRLLRAAAAQPPVDYDVRAGLERHRQLASTPAVASRPPVIAKTGVAAHTSASIGTVGLGAAGIAAVGALAAALFLHSTPRSLDDEKPSERLVAAARPSPAPAPPPSAQGPATVARLGEPPAAPSAGPDGALAARAPRPGEPSVSKSSTASPAAVTVAVRGVPTEQRATGAEDRGRASSASSGVVMPPAAGHGAPRANAASSGSAPAAIPSAQPVIVNDSELEAPEVARAERMLASNPSGALAIIRGLRSRFKSSFLAEERDYVEVMALHALGRSDEARTAATRFLNAYPGGAFGNRVRGVLSK